MWCVEDQLKDQSEYLLRDTTLQRNNDWEWETHSDKVYAASRKFLFSNGKLNVQMRVSQQAFVEIEN